MPQISLTSGTAFTGSSGISILDAATRAGVFFPYGCKTGRCSTCKCKVLSGQTRELHTETGLAEHEKEEGWILGCVRSAETDLTIEVDDLDPCDWLIGVDAEPQTALACAIHNLEGLGPVECMMALDAVSYLSSTILRVWVRSLSRGAG